MMKQAAVMNGFWQARRMYIHACVNRPRHLTGCSGRWRTTGSRLYAFLLPLRVVGLYRTSIQFAAAQARVNQTHVVLHAFFGTTLPQAPFLNHPPPTMTQPKTHQLRTRNIPPDAEDNRVLSVTLARARQTVTSHIIQYVPPEPRQPKWGECKKGV